MENIYPIIGLIVYFLLTAFLRKQRKDGQTQKKSTVRQYAERMQAAQKQARKQAQQQKNRGFSAERSVEESEDVPAKRGRMAELGSMLNAMAERFEEADDGEPRTDLLKNLTVTQDDWEIVEEDEIKVGTDITEFEGAPETGDTAVASDTVISEGTSVFDKDLSEVEIGAYATRAGAYKIQVSQQTPAELLEARLAGHTFFEKGIIYAEVIGPPVAFKREETW